MHALAMRRQCISGQHSASNPRTRLTLRAFPRPVTSPRTGVSQRMAYTGSMPTWQRMTRGLQSDRTPCCHPARNPSTLSIVLTQVCRRHQHIGEFMADQAELQPHQRLRLFFDAFDASAAADEAQRCCLRCLCASDGEQQDQGCRLWHEATIASHRADLQYFRMGDAAACATCSRFAQCFAGRKSRRVQDVNCLVCPLW